MIGKMRVFVWYGLGCSILVLLFLGLYAWSVPSRTTGAGTEETGPDTMKLLTGAQHYNVADAFKSDNDALPAHDFPPLEAAKSKIAIGFLVTLKAQAHVLHPYEVPERSRMVYFVMRTETENDRTWSQVELLQIDPKRQSLQSDPIGYTYGRSAAEVAAATKLLGFTDNDECLYATLKNENRELVYRVTGFRFPNGPSRRCWSSIASKKGMSVCRRSRSPRYLRTAGSSSCGTTEEASSATI